MDEEDEYLDATQDLGIGYGGTTHDTTGDKREVGKLCFLNYHNQLSCTSYVLYEGINIVGRGDESDVCIKLPGLSKKHSCIEYSNGNFAISDLGSKNRSSIGDNLLNPYVRYALKCGDVLTFGGENVYSLVLR